MTQQQVKYQKIPNKIKKMNIYFFHLGQRQSFQKLCKRCAKGAARGAAKGTTKGDILRHFKSKITIPLGGILAQVGDLTTKTPPPPLKHCFLAKNNNLLLINIQKTLFGEKVKKTIFFSIDFLALAGEVNQF